jgi:hypothetical protein
VSIKSVRAFEVIQKQKEKRQGLVLPWKLIGLGGAAAFSALFWAIVFSALG